MQVTPLPVYPVLQAQVKDPGLFVQVAVPEAQLEVPAVHSLMSAKERKRDELQLQDLIMTEKENERKTNRCRSPHCQCNPFYRRK